LTVGAPGRGTSCITTLARVLGAHPDEQPVRTTVLHFGSLDFVFDGLVELSATVVFSQSQPDTPAPPQG
jgi:hypothetical protein